MDEFYITTHKLMNDLGFKYIEPEEYTDPHIDREWKYINETTGEVKILFHEQMFNGPDSTKEKRYAIKDKKDLERWEEWIKNNKK